MNLAAWLAVLIVVALAVSMVDMVPIARARRAKAWKIRDDTPSVADFVILVPIWGSVAYLENVEYLSCYRARVWLCTTDRESDAFNASLDEIASVHGFTVFRGSVPRSPTGRKNARAVAGSIRDRLIRDASAHVDAPYFVCLDADTQPTQPLERLVGAIAQSGWDLVSVRLCPSNRDTWLARVQGHEYRMAMRLRRIMPWLVSGACHAGRTEAHRTLMARHSLFFQGNDAEIGLLAHAMGYRVGHVLFDVATTVPNRWWPWLRQRLAWAGGEFRLFIINVWLLPKHPAAFAYGALFVFLLLPFRWWAMFQPHWLLTMIVVYILYLTAMVYVNWRERDLALLLVPIYGLLIVFFICPFGIIWYARMAWADRNLGVIRPRRKRNHGNDVCESTLPATAGAEAPRQTTIQTLPARASQVARVKAHAEPKPAAEPEVPPSARSGLSTRVAESRAQDKALAEIMGWLMNPIAPPANTHTVFTSRPQPPDDDPDDPFAWPTEEQVAWFIANRQDHP
jgi:hypothetical protein